VLGATGDLARKKTFPALLALTSAGLMRSKARIVGCAPKHRLTTRLTCTAH
jgi:glucose-6-phosphate 1-dehydrogenase